MCFMSYSVLDVCTSKKIFSKIKLIMKQSRQEFGAGSSPTEIPHAKAVSLLLACNNLTSEERGTKGWL